MHPLLLGHRGSRSLRAVRENTFEAFNLALQHGCDGFEFDVRLTSDGVPIICHDAKFRRVPVSATPASHLPELPRLAAVLERYGTRAFLDIELKVYGIERQLLEMLARHPPKSGFVVSSFLPKVLLELRRLNATVPLGLICGNWRQLRRWRESPIEFVIARQSLVTRKVLQAVHDAGKSLFVWTVNRRTTMSRLAKWGVDGIISDRTNALVQTVNLVVPLTLPPRC